MNVLWWIKRLAAPIAAIATGTLCAHGAAGAVAFEVSQDGHRFRTVNLISGTETAADFYNYAEGSGSPDFGLTSGVVTSCLYLDTTTNMVSLLTIGGISQPTETTSGKNVEGYDLSVSGLPRTTVLSLNDTPHAIDYHDGGTILLASGASNDKTKGFTLSGLNKGRTLDIHLSLSYSEGQPQKWRLASGDPTDGGAFHYLYTTKDLYILEIPIHNVGAQGGSAGGSGPEVGGGNPGSGPSTGDAPGNDSVPEPVSGSVLAILAAALVIRPPRSCRRCKSLQ